MFQKIRLPNTVSQNNFSFRLKSGTGITLYFDVNIQIPSKPSFIVDQDGELNFNQVQDQIMRNLCEHTDASFQL